MARILTLDGSALASLPAEPPDREAVRQRKQHRPVRSDVERGLPKRRVVVGEGTVVEGSRDLSEAPTLEIETFHDEIVRDPARLPDEDAGEERDRGGVGCDVQERAHGDLGPVGYLPLPRQCAVAVEERDPPHARVDDRVAPPA